MWARCLRLGRRGRRRVREAGEGSGCDPATLPRFVAPPTRQHSRRYLATACGRRCRCGNGPVLPQSDTCERDQRSRMGNTAHHFLRWAEGGRGLLGTGNRCSRGICTRVHFRDFPTSQKHHATVADSGLYNIGRQLDPDLTGSVWLQRRCLREQDERDRFRTQS